MSELDRITAPVLSCEQARELESALFEGNENRAWSAMQAAGPGIARGILRDFNEIGGFPSGGRILVLIGKGHNGGDALLAADALLNAFPRATADVWFCFGARALRPLAARAWVQLQQRARDRLTILRAIAANDWRSGRNAYDLCVDGIFGFQFRPPVDERVRALVDAVNALPIAFRAAVDLPSGDVFRADFTYATGSVKAPLLTSEVAGRIRFIDLGFFSDEPGTGAGSARREVHRQQDRVLTDDVLRPLASLRRAHSDKRDFGHVFIVGSSRVDLQACKLEYSIVSPK